MFNLKSWVGKSLDWQPGAVATLHAVDVGLQVECHAMRAGAGGQIVSIRISQQLL
ncbi:hypothetical protein PanWU01x14_217060 [Parasponia andersonii]|uniref:Uncharacterized protein n=1 Tax=Parasponia andersonii TaxID=3476 RepID=A0A2P5BR94_PARAD|nr:hypothetical protein PanWU01x14_217060 [Parasponia andersonii]